MRTPYGKGTKFDRFVKAGYIVVSQDARGRYASDGTWESFLRFETHDAEDGYDTVEWAAKLPGSTGKVGTMGGSYNAFLQWRLAPLRPAVAGGHVGAQHPRPIHRPGRPRHHPPRGAGSSGGSSTCRPTCAKRSGQPGLRRRSPKQ